jgi:hypothetical protein
LNRKESRVVSICTDSDKKEIQKFVRETLAGEVPDFPVLIGGARVSRDIHSRGVPSNFIIDKGGTVRFFHWGVGEMNLNRFRTELEALAAE